MRSARLGEKQTGEARCLRAGGEGADLAEWKRGGHHVDVHGADSTRPHKVGAWERTRSPGRLREWEKPWRTSFAPRVTPSSGSTSRRPMSSPTCPPRPGAARRPMRCSAASAGRLDGAVLAAGLGPAPGAERPHLITQVNYFGVVDLLAGVAFVPGRRRPRQAVVVFSSNSTTTVPAVPNRAVRALPFGAAEKAVRSLRFFGRNVPTMAYAASTTSWGDEGSFGTRRPGSGPARGIRLTRWRRGRSSLRCWSQNLATPKEAGVDRDPFRVPIGGFGDPGHLARTRWSQCSPTLRTSCAEASGSSTAVRTHTSAPTTGPSRAGSGPPGAVAACGE